jgi:phage gp45-like
MNRNSLLETAGRSFHQIVRLTMNKAINDNPLMQELTGFAGMFGDGRGVVERIQHYGMTSVPLGPTQQQGGGDKGGQGGVSSQSAGTFAAGGGSGGGSGGGGGGGEGEAAEGIAVFAGGQRNHPIVIAVDDRRHRPMGLKPGENAQYDDAGQMTLTRRNGLYLLSCDNEDGEGKKQDRMVSLRHVEKKKQERQKSSGGSNGGGSSGGGSGGGARAGTFAANGGQQSQAPDHSNYKHEGETVNTELRVTKDKIEFRNGESVKAEHNKSSDKWDFKGKEHHVTSSDKHTVSTKQVAISGSTGIGLTGPTTINGSPAVTTLSLGPLLTLVDSLQARVAALEARLGA